MVGQTSAAVILNGMIDTIGKVAHEANRAFCSEIGDPVGNPWEMAPKWQRESVANGVVGVMLHPDITPEESHENWLRVKEAEGWVYGPEKDVDKKEHPCMVPYDRLPMVQRAKDELFIAVVKALMPRFQIPLKPQG